MANHAITTKICLITTSHLCSDPRLVKEATAFSGVGYRVHLVFVQFLPALVAHDQLLLEANPNWTCDVLDLTAKGGVSKFRRFLFLSVARLVKMVTAKGKAAAIILNPAFYWQLRKAINAGAQLYLAHNPGALPVAVKAAQYTAAKSGFDAEDFHRHEVSNSFRHPDALLKRSLEDAYIPQLDYFSTASPLISDRYQAIYQRTPLTLLNVFPRLPLSLHRPANSNLGLFWFSQTIGPDRGLETALEALRLAQLPLDLHLLGTVSAGYQAKLTRLAENGPGRIYFHQRVPQAAVMALAAQFDLGLSAELTKPLNRDICLTNKLFTYVQCGLAVVASRTSAQEWFIKKHPGAGRLYADGHELAAILTYFHTHRRELEEIRRYNRALGERELNWENESRQLLAETGSILGVVPWNQKC